MRGIQAATATNPPQRNPRKTEPSALGSWRSLGRLGASTRKEVGKPTGARRASAAGRVGVFHHQPSLFIVSLYAFAISRNRALDLLKSPAFTGGHSSRCSSAS